MDVLPNEIIVEIVNFLPQLKLFDMASINKHFNQLAKAIRWEHSCWNFRYCLKSYTFKITNVTILPFESYNGITNDEYTDAVTNLTRCENVYLYETTITSTIIKSLRNVRTLEFYYCEFKINDSELELLTHASSVYLVECCGIPDKYMSMMNIQWLKPCFEERIRDAKHLSHVKELDLVDVICTNPEIYSDLSRVEILSLDVGCCITDQRLSYLTGVRDLTLSNRDEITGSGFEFLNLKRIYLYNCDAITDDSLRYLANVEEVSIDYCRNLTESGMRHLTKAKYIFLSTYPIITDHGLKYLANVTTVDIQYNCDITDIGLSYLTGVKYLSLSRCTKITANGIASLTNAEEICLIDCASITTDVVRYMPHVTSTLLSIKDITCDHLEYLSNIKILVVWNDDFVITDKMRHLKKLEHLAIRYNSKITDSMLKSIAHIEHVELTDCAGITDAGIVHLANVNKLRLEGLDNITNQCINSLRGVDDLYVCCKNVQYQQTTKN